ncbi:MAG: hypothetical protein GXX84_07310 [Acidobacteria bacterium]|nr:hypothetical protein [Acidobacteriota bacterium]
MRLVNKLNLKFPTLFMILAILTILDILVPDLIPVLDELVLAILTVLLGMWKDRKPIEVYQEGTK